jgi:hypothetical protein
VNGAVAAVNQRGMVRPGVQGENVVHGRRYQR